MKGLLLALLVAGGFWDSFSRISRSNELRQRGQEFYRLEKYVQAVAAYRELANELEPDNMEARLNLGQALWKAGQTAEAIRQYTLVARSGAPSQLRSVAQLQLGNAWAQQQQYEKALQYYRQALISNPQNEKARFNYELLKKKLRDKQKSQPHQEQPEEPEKQPEQPPQQQPQQEPQAQPDQPKEQQKAEEKPDQAPNAGGSNQQQPGQEGKDQKQQSGTEKGSEKGLNRSLEGEDREGATPPPSGNEQADEETRRLQTIRQRLQESSMTPEKARMILNAMKEAETQYLQQLPRKASGSPDPRKPDW